MHQPSDQPARPGRRRALWRWLGFGAAVLVFLGLIPVLVLATDDSGGESGSALPAKPADFVGTGVFQAYTDSRDFPGGTAYLSGPHFSVGFSTLDVTTTAGVDYRAADDHEFLLLTARNPELADRDLGSATASVFVDGKARPVDLAKVEQTGLIVSVPKGHTATLRVTDEGRAQSLDLRTGNRGPDAIPGYYPGLTLDFKDADYSGSGKSGTGGCRRAVVLTLGFTGTGTAVLPWAPGAGWATPGRGWLTLDYTAIVNPVTLPDYPSLNAMPPACAVTMSFEWDLKHSVGIQTPQGEVAPVENVAESSAGGTFLFDVPLGMAGATLVVHPAGAFADDAGHSAPAVWSEPPPTARTPLVASK